MKAPNQCAPTAQSDLMREAFTKTDAALLNQILQAADDQSHPCPFEFAWKEFCGHPNGATQKPPLDSRLQITSKGCTLFFDGSASGLERNCGAQGGYVGFIAVLGVIALVLCSILTLALEIDLRQNNTMVGFLSFGAVVTSILAITCCCMGSPTVSSFLTREKLKHVELNRLADWFKLLQQNGHNPDEGTIQQIISSTLKMSTDSCGVLAAKEFCDVFGLDYSQLRLEFSNPAIHPTAPELPEGEPPQTLTAQV